MLDNKHNLLNNFVDAKIFKVNQNSLEAKLGNFERKACLTINLKSSLTKSKEVSLEFSSNSIINVMFGEQSLYLKKLQNNLDVKIDIFGNIIRIYGEECRVCF